MDAEEEIATAHNSGETAMAALETIRYDWGSTCQIECDGDQWRARRLDGLADGSARTAPIFSAPRFSVTTRASRFAGPPSS
jgi:hypothetical protein